MASGVPCHAGGGGMRVADEPFLPGRTGLAWHKLYEPPYRPVAASCRPVSPLVPACRGTEADVRVQRRTTRLD